MFFLFTESVAGYVEGKREHRCRQADESGREATPLLGNVNYHGLMSDLSLIGTGKIDINSVISIFDAN